jgi:colicin import membrane protein
MQDQYKQCWSYFGLGGQQRYVPEIRVQYAQDGSLIGQPALVNPPSDPNLRSLAESALRAVRKCNPMRIPAIYQPYYDQWKARVVRFDPQEML